MMKPYGRIKVQEDENGRTLHGSGCQTCPVIACATMTYRGSACASQRASYGLGDPLTNADHIRSLSDEELAKEAADALSYCAPGSRPSPEGCTSKMCVGCWLKWLKQPKEKEDG